MRRQYPSCSWCNRYRATWCDQIWPTCVGTGTNQKCSCRHQSVDLNYDIDFFSPEKKAYNGQWERRDGKETTTALRFTKTREAQGLVYEAQCDFVSASLTADTTSGGKKCIKSTTSGSHSFEVPSSNATVDDDTKGRILYEGGAHTHTHHHIALLLGTWSHLPPDSSSSS